MNREEVLEAARKSVYGQMYRLGLSREQTGKRCRKR